MTAFPAVSFVCGWEEMEVIVGPVAAVTTCFKKYFTFSGRAPRSEYWYFWLAIMVFSSIGGLIDGMFFHGDSVASLVLELVVFIPFLSVTARRLHDIGKSGWWQCLALSVAATGVALVLIGFPIWVVLVACLIAVVLQITWLLTRGDYGDNRFGPDPLVKVEADAPFAAA